MGDALFRKTEDGYRAAFPKVEIEFAIDRLRWDRHELFGQLSVSCGLAGARTVEDGLVSAGTFNFSSTRARRDRAREIADRVRAKPPIDFVGLLEEVSYGVLRAELHGEPAVLLRTVVPVRDEEFTLDGFAFPKRHATILFGDGDSLKSFLALWVLGRLAGDGWKVALFDWELDASTHHVRLRRLFSDAMPDVRYVRCDRPLVQEVDRLRRIVRDEQLDFAVYDSIGFACPGPPEAAEHALGYFRAARQVGVGALHIAHVRQGEDNDLKPFGSAFWHNGCRSSWCAKRADDEAAAHIGLYHRKANLSARHPAAAFTVTFSETQTEITPTSIAAISALAEYAPLWQRMKDALTRGPLTLVDLAKELDAKVETLDRTVRRKSGLFTRVSAFKDGITRIALVERRAS